MDFSKVHYLVLDDRWPIAYKPNRETLRLIGNVFPGCKIIGYKRAGLWQLWHLLMYSPSFHSSEITSTYNFNSLKHAYLTDLVHKNTPR